MGLGVWLKQVWTLARHSVLQAIRMKVVLIILIFLVIVGVALPAILKSDGTQAGQIRLIFTYYFYFIVIMLSVLTVFLSSATLNQEIKNQHILLLDPKPVSRGTVLVGKWLGVMIVDAALLAVMLVITYGFVKYFGQRFPGQSEAQHETLSAQLLVAWKAGVPPSPDVEELAREKFELLKKQQMLVEHKSEESQYELLRETIEKRAKVAPPYQPVTFVISGVPKVPADKKLAFRFRYGSSASKTDYEVFGRFRFKDAHGKDITEPHLWAYKVDTVHAFSVPPSVVRDDGTVEIEYTNFDPNGNTAWFPARDGLCLLFPVTTMGANFVRAGTMIFLWLAFFAMVGIFASTSLSFPVAVLLTATVLVVALLKGLITSDFIPKLVAFGPDVAPPWMAESVGDTILHGILRSFVAIFPGFSDYNVVPLISEGCYIGNWSILTSFFWLVVVRGGVLALLGWYLYSRRELAALTPTA